MSWFSSDPFHSFFNNSASGFADQDDAWPFTNEYRRRRSPPSPNNMTRRSFGGWPSSARQMQQKRAREEESRKRQLLQQQQEERQRQRQRMLAEQEYRRRLREQQEQEQRAAQQRAQEQEMLREYLANRMAGTSPRRNTEYSPQQQYYARRRSPFDQFFGIRDPMYDEEYASPEAYEGSPAYRRPATAVGRKRRKRNRSPGAQETAQPQKETSIPAQLNGFPKSPAELTDEEPAQKQYTTEEVALPSRLMQKSASASKRRRSPMARRIPDALIEEEPFTKSTTEPFSLHKMAEDDAMQDESSQQMDEELSPATPADAQRMTPLFEEIETHQHAPSAADRVRATASDQLEAEKEHENRRTIEIEEPEIPMSEEETQSQPSEEEEEEKQDGMTPEDVQTISKIREINQKAQQIRIPSLKEVSRIKDLIVPEELNTQLLLQLDNLTVSEFSRPFRKQVIQHIQKQLSNIDSLKKEFRNKHPDAEE